MIYPEQPEYRPDPWQEEQVDAYHAEREEEGAREALYTELTRIIHSAMMYGLPEDDAKLLCHGCGVSMMDVEHYGQTKGAMK